MTLGIFAKHRLQQCVWTIRIVTNIIIVRNILLKWRNVVIALCRFECIRIIISTKRRYFKNKLRLCTIFKIHLLNYELFFYWTKINKKFKRKLSTNIPKHLIYRVILIIKQITSIIFSFYRIFDSV